MTLVLWVILYLSLTFYTTQPLIIYCIGIYISVSYSSLDILLFLNTIPVSRLAYLHSLYYVGILATFVALRENVSYGVEVSNLLHISNSLGLNLTLPLNFMLNNTTLGMCFTCLGSNTSINTGVTIYSRTTSPEISIFLNTVYNNICVQNLTNGIFAKIFFATVADFSAVIVFTMFILILVSWTRVFRYNTAIIF